MKGKEAQGSVPAGHAEGTSQDGLQQGGGEGGGERMRSADSSPGNVDVFSLARREAELHGSTPIMAFARMVADAPDQGKRQAEWSVRGSVDAHGRMFLAVSVQASPLLVCQRCLAPVEVSVNSNNTLQLVESADLPEDDLDDPEAPECIQGSKRFDLAGLVEDELILALPYVPRHDVCPALPDALLQAPEAVETREKPSPFAALEALRKPSGKP